MSKSYYSSLNLLLLPLTSLRIKFISIDYISIPQTIILFRLAFSLTGFWGILKFGFWLLKKTFRACFYRESLLRAKNYEHMMSTLLVILLLIILFLSDQFSRQNKNIMIPNRHPLSYPVWISLQLLEFYLRSSQSSVLSKPKINHPNDFLSSFTLLKKFMTQIFIL